MEKPKGLNKIFGTHKAGSFHGGHANETSTVADAISHLGKSKALGEQTGSGVAIAFGMLAEGAKSQGHPIIAKVMEMGETIALHGPTAQKHAENLLAQAEGFAESSVGQPNHEYWVDDAAKQQGYYDETHDSLPKALGKTLMHKYKASDQ